jgi:hypothetical protein
MASSDRFVYSRRDLMVAGVAMAIIVALLGLGFGLASGASLGNFRHRTYNFFGDIISYLYQGLKIDIISYLMTGIRGGFCNPSYWEVGI